jgi:hypothetical protein
MHNRGLSAAAPEMDEGGWMAPHPIFRFPRCPLPGHAALCDTMRCKRVKVWNTQDGSEECRLFESRRVITTVPLQREQGELHENSD